MAPKAAQLTARKSEGPVRPGLQLSGNYISLTEQGVEVIPRFTGCTHIEQPSGAPQVTKVETGGSDNNIEHRRDDTEVWKG